MITEHTHLYKIATINSSSILGPRHVSRLFKIPYTFVIISPLILYTPAIGHLKLSKSIITVFFHIFALDCFLCPDYFFSLLYFNSSFNTKPRNLSQEHYSPPATLILVWVRFTSDPRGPRV